MNDFTKEELEDIDFALLTVYLGNSALRKKIQFMIENYCDHESSDKYPNEFKWQLCCKCGKDFKC